MKKSERYEIISMIEIFIFNLNNLLILAIVGSLLYAMDKYLNKTSSIVNSLHIFLLNNTNIKISN